MKNSSKQDEIEEVTALQIDNVTSLKQTIEKERETAKNYLNRLKYLQADFENYKRRVKKEINETIRHSNRRLILELLPVLDELEYAVGAGKQDSGTALLEGVEMTLKKFYSILEREGVTPIKIVGETFDPAKHEAIQRVPTNGQDGAILEEIRKGFMFRDTILRPSLVKVAVGSSEEVREDE